MNAALEIVSQVLRKKMKEQNLLPSKLTETTGFVQMQYLTECVQRNALDTKFSHSLHYNLISGKLVLADVLT